MKIIHYRYLTKATQEIPRMQRYAILEAGHATESICRRFGDYSDMFISLLASKDAVLHNGRERRNLHDNFTSNSLEEQQEEWFVFDPSKNELPPVSDMREYQGIVITGSAYDAHSDGSQSDEWIPPFRRYLAELLQPLPENRGNPSPKVLGICFGHQIIAHSLGGRSGKAAVGWEIGVKQIQLHPKGLSMFSREINGKESLHILESHQDQVIDLPPNAVLLASSTNTPIEMYAMPNILCMQGHPEFQRYIVEDIIERRSQGRGTIPDDIASEARTELETTNADTATLARICKNFLKSADTVNVGETY